MTKIKITVSGAKEIPKIAPTPAKVRIIIKSCRKTLLKNQNSPKSKSAAKIEISGESQRANIAWVPVNITTDKKILKKIWLNNFNLLTIRIRKKTKTAKITISEIEKLLILAGWTVLIGAKIYKQHKSRLVE